MPKDAPELAPPPLAAPASRRARLLAAFGPGLAVMLADTDVGSILTAGQSGAQWGYRLLPLQFLLIPLLYIAQELAVRLGALTGRGHGELIRETFGPAWAWASVAALGVSVAGALLTEFSGIAGMGELYGVPRAASLALACALLLGVMITGSQRRAERAAVAAGLFELTFLAVAWEAGPHPAAVLAGALSPALSEPGFLWLAAANVGSAVLPWMLFYQQSAVADRRLGPEHLPTARLDTLLGAVIAQLVMSAALVATAAMAGHGRGAAVGVGLGSVGAMSAALTPVLGPRWGRLVFSLGVLGAAFVAAVVTSLALAWGVGEAAGRRRALERHPLASRAFAGTYAACVLGAAAVVAAWPDLVGLSVAVQVANALVLPYALGMLLALALRALPPAHRPRGARLWAAVAVCAVTAGLGVACALLGLAGPGGS